MSFVFCFCVLGQNFGNILKGDTNSLWILTPDKFKKTFVSPEIYKWNSTQKKSLHYAANRTKKSLYFLDWSVTEADFNFENQQLNSMFLNIYNKSCSNNKHLAVKKKTFLAFLGRLRDSLNTFYKVKHSKISIKLINSARCYSCVWDSPSAYVILKWSYDGSNKYNFIVNYATVYLYKNKQDFAKTNNSKAAALSLDELKSHIKINKDGDRYLEIPMVDQGKRGYCVVACAERILKYYKVNIDQHILAQAANTSSKGMLATEIEKSMKKVGAKCNFHVKEISEYSPLVSNSNILKFIKKYNRYAKREGKTVINIRRVRGYKRLFRMMDEEILVKTKIDYYKSDFRKFKIRVQKTIDNGMPVLWGVMLGLVKEAKIPQNIGGHMRLIIGYNPKNEEIIYTDTWGRGHEFKKISWGKAWAMTNMAYVFIPKK